MSFNVDKLNKLKNYIDNIKKNVDSNDESCLAMISDNLSKEINELELSSNEVLVINEIRDDVIEVNKKLITIIDDTLQLINRLNVVVDINRRELDNVGDDNV